MIRKNYFYSQAPHNYSYHFYEITIMIVVEWIIFSFERTQCQVPRRRRMSWQKNSEKSKWMSDLKPVDFSIFDEILPFHSAFIVRCEGRIINHFQHRVLLTISELDEGSSSSPSLLLKLFFLLSLYIINNSEQIYKTIEWLKLLEEDEEKFLFSTF